VVALFVVMLVLCFLTIDVVVVAFAHRRALARARAGQVVAPPVEAPGPTGPPPADVFVSPLHAWLRLDKEGGAALGADGLAGALLGAPDGLEVASPGALLERGAVVATLRRGDRWLALRTPVSGAVQDVNLAVVDTPSLLVADTWNTWICKMKPEDLGAALRRSRVGAEAAAWLAEERERLRELLVTTTARPPAVGATLQDGGPVAPDAAEGLDDAVWSAIELEFFGAARLDRDAPVDAPARARRAS